MIMVFIICIVSTTLVKDYPTLLQLIGLGSVVGVLPVYLGLAAALILFKGGRWAWQLIGVSTGILLYLFFDLMDESLELVNSPDVLSWVVFTGSFLLSFFGLFLSTNTGREKESTHRLQVSSPTRSRWGWGFTI